jgi:hypothetical protein
MTCGFGTPSQGSRENSDLKAKAPSTRIKMAFLVLASSLNELARSDFRDLEDRPNKGPAPGSSLAPPTIWKESRT